MWGRRAIPVIAAACFLAGMDQGARAAQLLVDAPGACVDSASLAGEVADLIGKPLAEVPEVDFTIRIVASSGKWLLHLETVDQPAAERSGSPTKARARGSRDIEGASCAELAEAAAVAIAVSVRSMDEASGAQARTSAETPPPAAAPRPAMPASIERTGGASATPSATAPPSPWHPALTIALATDTGTLPGTGPGVDVEGSLQRGWARLTLLAAWFASRDHLGPGSAGGSFALAFGGALACVAPRWGRWTPLACGGIELGRLAGTGLGVTRADTGATFWRAARADAGMTARVGNLSLMLRAGIALPLARPGFVVDESQLVYQPSRAAIRGTAGLELPF